MRWMLLILSLLLLAPGVAGQQHYTEGACILLQQQIDRFSHLPQNSNYRSAKREYDRYCNKETRPAQRQTSAARAVTVQPVPAAPIQQQIKAEPRQQTATTAEPVAVEPVPQAAQTKPDTQMLPATAGNTDLPAPVAAAVPVQDAPLISAITAPDYAPVKVQSSAADDMFMFILTSIPLIAANIVALLLVVFLLTSWFGLNLPGFKGVFAEYKLNRLLRWRLSGRYRHFRKLKLLTAKDERVLVDHLVLSPFGIFVIAVKSERGRIEGAEQQANWARHYFGRARQLMNPLHQNFKNRAAVKHLLQLQDNETESCLHSVVAFSRVARFETAMPANVTYVDGVASFIKTFQQPCFTEEQLQRYAAVLQQASTG